MLLLVIEIFPGGVQKNWNFRRGGGYILWADFGKSRGERGGGGAIRIIPSVGGVWIFSGTTHYFFDMRLF